MVFGYHVATRTDPTTLDPVARWLQKYGFLGVDVFFPLSGFLITRFILQDSETRGARTFFLRRFFRIVPLYIVAVTLFAVAAMIFGDGSESISAIWKVYLFLTGWCIFFFGLDDVPYRITWSLSVEEFAYLIVGLSGYFLRRLFPMILIGGTVASLILKYILFYADIDNIYYFPLARFDSIACGALLAIGMHRVETKLLSKTLCYAFTMSLLIACCTSLILYKTLLFMTVAMISTSMIALLDSQSWLNSSKLARMCAGVGFYSYFLYLFQFFNIDAIHMLAKRYPGWFPIGFWEVLVLSVATTLAQAVVSFHIFERPIIRFGRRLESSTIATIR